MLKWLTHMSGLSWMLALLAAAYLLVGFYGMVFRDRGALDLRLRWLSQQTAAKEASPDAITETIQYQPYPPWAFFSGQLFVLSMSWAASKIYFAGVNLVALLSLVWWLILIGKGYSNVERWFVICTAFAVAGMAVCLRLGQYSIIVTACLAWMIWLLERKKELLAGILLGVAMIKPHLAIPFACIPLVRRQWRCLMVTLIYLAVGTLVSGVDSGESLLESFRGMNNAIHKDMRMGLLDGLKWIGLNHVQVMVIGLVVGGSICIWFIHKYQHVSSLTLAALCAVTSLLWSYSRRYDQSLLFFLMVAIASRVPNPHGRNAWFPFLVVGITVWTPFTEPLWHGCLPVVIGAIWIFGVAWLCVETSAQVAVKQADVSKSVGPTNSSFCDS